MGDAAPRLNPGAGPAGWTASNLLGLSTQVPPTPSIAVVGRPPSGLDRTRFTRRSNVRRCDLKPTEIAVLEVLRDYPAHVEVPWPKVVDRIRELAANGHVDLQKLTEVAATEHRQGLHGRVSELANS